VRALKARIDTFAAVLPSGSALARSFDDALLRTLSSGWRSDVALGTQQRAAVRSELDGQMHRVYIASKPRSLVTLTSHSGVVPITVGNDLDTPVRVVVKINAGQHLRIPGAGRVAKTIPAHRRVPFDLHAAARTSGVFPLTVQLFTPNPPGAAYDEPIQLFVRSTAYGSVALLITGGATVVLLVAVGVRLTRRWLGARAAARGTA
jgi:hypothetical protein